MKCKMFFAKSLTPADEQFNEWISTHPNVSILTWEFRGHASNEHAIFIIYEEGEASENRRN